MTLAEHCVRVWFGSTSLDGSVQVRSVKQFGSVRFILLKDMGSSLVRSVRVRFDSRL